MTSEESELIAKQQLEISRLKKQRTQLICDLSEISSILCCIGGGLNDNKLGYTPEQKKELHAIRNIAERDLP